jgi:branched-chain amino acid transport system substrate-binding protein
VFPYVFTTPTNFWSLSTTKTRFIGHRAGGMGRLKGRKIVYVYHDSD